MPALPVPGRAPTGCAIMVDMTTGTSVRAITATAIAVVGALALVGCTGDGPGGTASSSASAGPGSSRTASPTPIGSPVAIPCATLVPSTVFDTYGRTFTLHGGAAPEKGSTAAVIVEQRGEACVWTDSADDATVTVAVASLPAANLTRLKDTLFESSHSVPTYSVEGYFIVRAGTGRADEFVDPYWVKDRKSVV